MKSIAFIAALSVASLSAFGSNNIATSRLKGGEMSLFEYPNGAVRVIVPATDTEWSLDTDPYYVTSPKKVVSWNGGDTPWIVTPNVALIRNADGESIRFTDQYGVYFGDISIKAPTATDSVAAMAINTLPGEYIYGAGQFQDGMMNINGLTRSLQQVNTQIAVPMVISNRGYGILWNSPTIGTVNQPDTVYVLHAAGDTGEKVAVDVTGTTGNRREERHFGRFATDITVPADDEYCLHLNVGQTMARRHNIVVDGVTVADTRNLWLPPTTSVIVPLTAGKHHIEVNGEVNDKPTVGVRRGVDSFDISSPHTPTLDFTVFVGTPDEIIAQYRELTGTVPKMPAWGLGYIHCRERYVSQDDLLTNALEFRHRNIPIDVIVQDWQYWGKYGWNAMRFDEEQYSDPKAMTDQLHDMDMRLMVSVWAKADRNSEVGKMMAEKGYYIDPTCDWVDFFNPEAADAYVKSYHDYLFPAGIDAWWQDATEPENDDLLNRRVAAGTIDGNTVRNIFPLKVNEAVHGELSRVQPDRRQMILTRSAAPGIQRYGVSTWSGDVGNDWATLRTQLNGGLNLMATGMPWWTYDAGGFFRPGDQHSNPEYQECMLRWIEASVFLPLMRVHGYQSQTEPWRYSPETQDAYVKNIRLRYALLPYIYSNAMRVSTDNYTLMRPMVMDFADDPEALKAADEQVAFMFGPSLLVSPVTEPKVSTWSTYLPKASAVWYDFATGKPYAGGTKVTTNVTLDAIPVFVKQGSIIPWNDAAGLKSSVDALNSPELMFKLLPGADATFTLWEDDGISNSPNHSEITFSWDDKHRQLKISPRVGAFPNMPATRTFTIVTPDGAATTLKYDGKEVVARL